MALFKITFQDHPLGTFGQVVTDAQIRLWSAVADIRFLVESGVLKPLGDAMAQLRTEMPTVEELLRHNVELADNLQEHAEQLAGAEKVFEDQRAQIMQLTEEIAIHEEQKRDLLETQARVMAGLDERGNELALLRAQLADLQDKPEPATPAAVPEEAAPEAPAGLPVLVPSVILEPPAPPAKPGPPAKKK